MDPFTASMGASAVGGVVSGIGSLFSGGAESAMYNYQAGIAEQNAKIAKQNEAWSTQAGENQSMAAGLRGRAQTGQIIADRAASNLDVKSGSNADVVAGQQKINLMDQSNIRSNAYKQAYGYDIESTQYQNEAAALKTGAANAQTAGDLGLVSSLIGGATSVATKWQQGQQFGVYGGGGSSSGSGYYDV